MRRDTNNLSPASPVGHAPATKPATVHSVGVRLSQPWASRRAERTHRRPSCRPLRDAPGRCTATSRHRNLAMPTTQCRPCSNCTFVASTRTRLLDQPLWYRTGWREAPLTTSRVLQPASSVFATPQDPMRSLRFPNGERDARQPGSTVDEPAGYGFTDVGPEWYPHRSDPVAPDLRTASTRWTGDPLVRRQQHEGCSKAHETETASKEGKR